MNTNAKKMLATVAKKVAKQRGVWSYARMAKGLNIPFEDAYVGLFGKLPRKGD